MPHRRKTWIDKLEDWLFGKSPSPPSADEMLQHYTETNTELETAADEAIRTLRIHTEREERMMKEITQNLEKARGHLVNAHDDLSSMKPAGNGSK